MDIRPTSDRLRETLFNVLTAGNPCALKSLGITSGVEMMQKDVGKALPRLQTEEIDFIFLDPPYRLEQAYRDTMTVIGSWRALKTTALVIAEHEKKFDPGEEFGELNRIRRLQQGDAALSFYRRAGTQAA